MIRWLLFAYKWIPLIGLEEENITTLGLTLNFEDITLKITSESDRILPILRYQSFLQNSFKLEDKMKIFENYLSGDKSKAIVFDLGPPIVG